MNVIRLYRCHICRFYMAFLWQGGFNVHADIYITCHQIQILVYYASEKYWDIEMPLRGLFEYDIHKDN